MPDFQFYYILFTEVIDNYISASQISGPGFNIVITGSVNNRAELEKEIFSSDFFNKSFIAVMIKIVEMLDEFFKDPLHV